MSDKKVNNLSLHSSVSCNFPLQKGKKEIPTPPDSSSPSSSFEARYAEDTTRSSTSPEQLEQTDWDTVRNLVGRDTTEEYTGVGEIEEAEDLENTPEEIRDFLNQFRLDQLDYDEIGPQKQFHITRASYDVLLQLIEQDWRLSSFCEDDTSIEYLEYNSTLTIKMPSPIHNIPIQLNTARIQQKLIEVLGKCTKSPRLIPLCYLDTPIKLVQEDEDYEQRINEQQLEALQAEYEVAETEQAKRKVEVKLDRKTQIVADYETSRKGTVRRPDGQFKLIRPVINQIPFETPKYPLVAFENAWSQDGKDADRIGEEYLLLSLNTTKAVVILDMHYPRNGEVILDRSVVVRLFRLDITEDENEIVIRGRKDSDMAICETDGTLSGSPTEAVISFTLRDFLLDEWMIALTESGEDPSIFDELIHITREELLYDIQIGRDENDMFKFGGGAVGQKPAQKTKIVKREFQRVTASSDGSYVPGKRQKVTGV
ncbi:hypothetical protein BTUL_0246g00010 [Botrytis tulipae]|uniref:Uncharacterized protein n=1 Tax=Botrytis tulipae TaxID=87230 RepID=A0A4Z1E6N5_9HELO|nr:hypothetical protein BTUL_0246g00010 [Botrytis tulipae]